MIKIQKKSLKSNLIKNKKKEENFNLFSRLSIKGKIYFFIVLFFTIYTIFVPYFFKNKDISLVLRSYLFFFTNQTILTVFLLLISFFFNIPFKYSKIYFIFNFIVLVNSLLTSIFYNTIIEPLWEENLWKEIFSSNCKNTLLKEMFTKEGYFLKTTMFQHLYVTFFGFPLFFLFFVPFSINLKKKKDVFCTFLHPIIFLSIYYVIMLFFRCKDENKCYFPYPMVQCPKHFKLSFLNETFIAKLKDVLGGMEIVVLMTLIVFFVIFAFFFIFVFYLKNKFNKNFLFHKISSKKFLNYINLEQINNKNKKIMKNKKNRN